MVEAGSAEVYVRAKLADFEKQMSKARGETKSFADNAEKQTGRVERAFSQSAGSILRSLRNIGLGLAAAFSVRAISDYADRYTELSNALKIIGGEQTNVNQKIQDLHDISKRTRAPLEAIAKLYQRVSIAASELGTSQEDVLTFTENVGLALAQQGGSAAQASGALLQLSQAIGSGVVRAEEFNSILEGAYPIAMAAAKGLDAAGGSVARLRSLVIAGKVSSKEFFDAILSQSDELNKAFERTTPTTSQAFQQLSDSLLLFFGRISETTEASKGFAGAIIAIANAVTKLSEPATQVFKTLSDNMQRILTYAGTAAAFFAAPFVASFVAAAFSIKGLTTALTFLRGALIRTGIGALIVLAGELVYQFIQLTERTGGVQQAFEGLKTAAGGLVPALGSIWAKIKYGWYSMLAEMQKTWADFLHAIGDATLNLPGFEDVGLEIKGMAMRAGSAFYEMQAAASAAADEAERLKKEAEDAFSAGIKLGPNLGALISGTFSSLDPSKSFDSVKAMWDALKPKKVVIPGDETGTKKDKYANLTQSIKDNIEALKIEAQTFGMSEEAATRFRTQQELLNAAKDSGMKIDADVINSTGQLADEYARAQQKVEDFKLAQELAGDFIKGFAHDLRQGKSAMEAFSNALNRLADKLLDMALDSAINMFLANLFPGGGGIGSIIGSIFGGARAAGGQVQAGKSYTVGERGVERFVPNQNGMIIPNNALSSGEQKIMLTLDVKTDPGVMVEIADQRISKSAPGIVQVSVQQSQRVTRDALPGMIQEAQARNL